MPDPRVHDGPISVFMMRRFPQAERAAEATANAR
jgi:hypothetical protein